MLISRLHRILRIPALVLLMFFLWTVAEPWNYDKDYALAATNDLRAAMAENKMQKQLDDYYKKQDKEKGKLKAQKQNASVPEDKWPELMQRMDDALTAMEIKEGDVPAKDEYGLSRNKRAEKMSPREAEIELDAAMAAIEDEEKNLWAELQGNRRMLEDMKASDELFKRQTDFENQVRMKMLEVKQAYNDIKGVETGPKVKDSAKLSEKERKVRKDKKRKQGKKKMRALLEEAKPKRLVELDPDNLPNQRITEKDIKKKEPRKGSKHGVLWRKKKIELVSADPYAYGVIAAAQAAYDAKPEFVQASYRPDMPPDAEDLASTIETEATPDIIDLAENQLSCDPVQMFNWVHNNIDYVPYYGSMKGANETLWQKEANDMDQASLLISLYRHCNIPARYVVGTVEVPIEKAMNWAGGFTNEFAAFQAFLYGGIPLRPVVGGGKLKGITMEHVWIEAWLSEERYRGGQDGAANGEYGHDKPFQSDDPFRGGKMWFQLDASYKQYEFTNPVDIVSVLNFDIDSYRTSLMNAITLNDNNVLTNFDSENFRLAMEQLYNALIAYQNTNGAFSYSDICGNKSIIQSNSLALPNNDIIQNNVIIDRFSYILDEYNLFYQVQFSSTYDSAHDVSTEGYQSVTLSSSALLSNDLTIHYSPCSNNDLEIMRNYFYRVNTHELPTYLIDVKPLVKHGSATIYSGECVSLGKKQVFRYSILSAANSTYSKGHIHNDEIFAGSTIAIVFDAGEISQNKMSNSLNNVISLNDSHSLLSFLGNAYFHLLDFNNKTLASSNNYNLQRSFSWGMVKNVFTTAGLGFGQLTSKVSTTGITLDIPGIQSILLQKRGEYSKQLDLILSKTLASYTSFLEHHIIELFLRTKSVSTVKVLSQAAIDGTPIYKINKSNSHLLQDLIISQEMHKEFENAIASGLNIIAPIRSVRIEQWAGFGYEIVDANGSGAYLIDFGYNGSTQSCADLYLAVADVITGIFPEGSGQLIQKLDMIIDAFAFVATRNSWKKQREEGNVTFATEFMMTAINGISFATDIGSTQFYEVGIDFLTLFYNYLVIGFSPYDVQMLLECCINCCEQAGPMGCDDCECNVCLGRGAYGSTYECCLKAEGVSQSYCDCRYKQNRSIRFCECVEEGYDPVYCN